MIIGVTYQDEKILNQFKSYLFEQKEQFTEYYNKSRSAQICLDIVPEALHLKAYISDIIFKDFRDCLSDKISDSDLMYLKVQYESENNRRMVISLIK